MKIIIDSREQRKILFKCNSEIRCLNFGDYGCELDDGHVVPSVFERKSCADLFGSLSKGYSRLRNCFERANKAGFKMVICIEGTKEKILKGYVHSRRNGCSIVLQLETIKERYGIDHIYFQNRIAMAKYIEQFYIRYENEYLDRLRGANVSKKSDTGLSQKENDS